MASPTIEAAENIITKIKASVDDVFKFRDEFVVVHGLEAVGCRDQEVEGKMKEALQQVETLAQHQDVRSGPALGRVLFERGRLLSIVPSQAATAEQDLGRASKFGAPGAWTLLGECLYNRGDLPAAATCFNRTLSMGEEKVALRNLSMLMRGLPTNSPEQREENINKGVEYARRAVKQDPGDGQSWMVLGNALLAAFFAGHANTTTLQACKAAYARAEHDKKASLLPELHLSKHQVAWYEEQYSAALASIKTACQLEPSWLECQVKRQQCIKFLRTLVVMVSKTGHLSNKRLQTLIKNIRPNQLGPYEHSGTAISGNNKPDLVLFSQLVPNTNTDKIVQGMVVSTLVPESGIPFVMCLVDAEGTCLPVSVYNWAPGSEVKIGDAVAVVAPVLKEQTISLESEETAASEKPATAAKSSRERTVQGRMKLQNNDSKKFGNNIVAKKVEKMTCSSKSEKESGPKEELPSKEINEGEIDSVKNVREDKLRKKEPDKSGDNTASDIDPQKCEKSTTLNENDRPLSNQNTSCIQGTTLDATAENDKSIGMENAEQMEYKQHNACKSYTQDANRNQTGGSSVVENVKEENHVEPGHENTNGNDQEDNTINNVVEVAMEDEMNKNMISASNISSVNRDTLREEANEPASKMARTEAGAEVASNEIVGTERTEAAKARPPSKGDASSSRTKDTFLEKKVTTTLPRRTPTPASASNTSTTNSNNNRNAMLSRSLTDKESSSVGRKSNSVNAAKSSVMRSGEKVQSSGSKPRATSLLKKQPTPGPSSSRNSSTLPNTTSDTSKNVKATVLPTRKSNVSKSVICNSSATKTPPKEATSSLSAKGSDAVPRVPDSSSTNNTVKCESKSTLNNKSLGASDCVGTAKKAKPVLGRREAKTGSLAGNKQPLVSSGRKLSSKTASTTTSVPSSNGKNSPSGTEKSGEVVLRSLRVVAPVMLVVNKRQVMAGQVAASYIVSQSKPE